MSQTQVQKPAPQRTTEADAQEIAARDAEVQAAQTKQRAEILDEADAWLDEIDEALSGLDTKLAEEFVQKGGE